MMQTAEIETARPVIRIVDDDEVFLASQKFFFETFFPEVRVWPCAERYLDEEEALRDALFWTTACRTDQAWKFSAHCF